MQIGPTGQRLYDHWFRHPTAMAVSRRSRWVQFASMFFGSNYLCFTTIMWERSLMEESGPFTDAGRFCADVHMWLKMLHRARITYLPQPLIRYRWAQNLSLKYDADAWYCADFLARRAVIHDCQLSMVYPLLLRLKYGTGFVRRLSSHLGSRRRVGVDRMLEAMRESWR